MNIKIKNALCYRNCSRPCTTCTCAHCMLTEILYPLQYGDTPLHCATKEGHTTCVEHLLSTCGINVNIKNRVGWSTNPELTL